MNTGAPASGPALDARLVRRLYDRSGARQWALSARDFAAALARSAARRFAGAAPAAAEVGRYLESLRLEDLALACACAHGSEPAWERFVRDFRPILLRMASRGQQADRGRDVADSLYAELYGLDERGGTRRSLFDYFHGRSTLAGWLQAVVAQRLVDRARASRRFEPLPEDESAAAARARTPAPERNSSPTGAGCSGSCDRRSRRRLPAWTAGTGCG